MLESLFIVFTQCLAEWAERTSSQLCYLGLFALYLAEYSGVNDRRVYLWGATMYLALYLLYT